MKKLLMVLFCLLLLVGCSSNKTETKPSINGTLSVQEEKEVKEYCVDFFKALNSGDMDKVLTYTDEELGNDIKNLIPESVIDSLKEFGFSEKALNDYRDYSDYLQTKIYGTVSNFEPLTANYENEIYVVNGTLNTINISKFDNYVFDDYFDDDTYNLIDQTTNEKGEEEGLNLYMTEAINRMKYNLDTQLASTSTESNNASVYLIKTNDGYQIIDVVGLFVFDADVENYDSHGIYTTLDEGWVYSDAHMTESTYAVMNEYYINDSYAELHFTEQLASVTNQKAYNEYAQTTMIDEVRENFSDYDTVDVVSIPVKIDNKDFYGVYVDAVVNDTHVYELDIPVYTGDGNLTMIAIVSVYEDVTQDILKLIHY